MNGEELGRCESEELLINFDEREREEDYKKLNDNNENVDKSSVLQSNDPHEYDERIDQNDHENEDESFNDIENEPYPHLLSRYKYRVNHKGQVTIKV